MIINVSTIKNNFKDFIENNPNYLYKINDFILTQKELFYDFKINEYLNQGVSRDIAVNKARQGWVSTVGKVLEDIIEHVINDFCYKYGLKLTKDTKLKSKNLSKELDLVYRRSEERR